MVAPVVSPRRVILIPRVYRISSIHLRWIGNEVVMVNSIVVSRSYPDANIITGYGVAADGVVAAAAPYEDSSVIIISYGVTTNDMVVSLISSTKADHDAITISMYVVVNDAVSNA